MSNTIKLGYNPATGQVRGLSLEEIYTMGTGFRHMELNTELDVDTSVTPELSEIEEVELLPLSFDEIRSLLPEIYQPLYSTSSQYTGEGDVRFDSFLSGGSYIDPETGQENIWTGEVVRNVQNVWNGDLIVNERNFFEGDIEIDIDRVFDIGQSYDFLFDYRSPERGQGNGYGRDGAYGDGQTGPGSSDRGNNTTDPSPDPITEYSGYDPTAPLSVSSTALNLSGNYAYQDRLTGGPTSGENSAVNFINYAGDTKHQFQDGVQDNLALVFADKSVFADFMLSDGEAYMGTASRDFEDGQNHRIEVNRSVIEAALGAGIDVAAGLVDTTTGEVLEVVTGLGRTDFEDIVTPLP